MLPGCLLTIVWSYSRGGFLALAAGLLAYAICQRRQVPAVGAVVLLGVGAAAAIPSDYLDRMNTITRYEQESSAANRIYFWQIAIEMVRDRPLGVGLGNYESEYDRYDSSNGQYGVSRAVHSSHLQTLAETGFIGCLVFEWLNAYSLLALWRIRRQALDGRFGDPEKDQFFLSIASALFASTIAFLVGGSFLGQALNDLNWFTYAIVAAVQRAAIDLRAADAKGVAAEAAGSRAAVSRSLPARHAARTAIRPISGV
jgi:O-antigen ligase